MCSRPPVATDASHRLLVTGSGNSRAVCGLDWMERVFEKMAVVVVQRPSLMTLANAARAAHSDH